MPDRRRRRDDDDEWRAGERERRPSCRAASALSEIDWNDYLDNYSNDCHSRPAAPADYDDDKRPGLESTLVRAQSLTEHLIWQLPHARI